MRTTVFSVSAVVAACGMGVATAATAASEGNVQDAPITIAVEAPRQGDVFACRIPVSLRHPEDVELEKLTLVASIYRGNVELGGTGLTLGGRPLVRDRYMDEVEYETVPLQFELNERDCRDATGIAIVLARCNFAATETVDCLDKLRVEPQVADGIRFYIGPPASVD